MIGMPVFGLLADRIGKRALLMVVGSALLVPPFLLMAYTHLPLEPLHGHAGGCVRARARGALAGGHLPRARRAARLGVRAHDLLPAGGWAA